jgi:hypothetical protein
MTWALLALVVMLVLVVGADLRLVEFTHWRWASSGPMGVEGARKLGKKTRSALAAATAMLR